MSSFSQENRLLRFKGIFKQDAMLPERVSGVEVISGLFRYEVDLLSPVSLGAKFEAFDVVGTTATIGIGADSAGTERFINGIIASFELRGGDEEFQNYRAVIVPSLWALTLNKNTRTFQEQNVIDVIKHVLEPFHISPTDDTTGPWQFLEYCTQYRETDFQFISRLMEQHGIIYYFKHTENSHVLTLQDDSSKLGECSIQSKFRYAPQPGKSEGFFDFVVDNLVHRSTLVTGKFTTWDHSLIRNSRVRDPLTSAFTEGPLGSNDNEVYDYADSAAAFLKNVEFDKKIDDQVGLFQFVRLNASDSGSLVAEGTSNAIPLATGFTFNLTEHPQELVNDKYLVTRVEHNVQQLPSYRSRTAPSPKPYTNRFTAASPHRYSPPLITAKPRVQGLHTGLVATRGNEDSFLDEFGRVCVKFWWDRQKKDLDSVDNTMLRVAQSWAGKGWGTYFWPRLGDEVLIDFIEGDPDQPIVVGSVYNGVNQPKYPSSSNSKLSPPQYTLSGILTRSSKDGSAANANELRFEDLKGKEQIFMNAERDYDLHVENTWHSLIGNEQHTTVGSSRVESIGKNSDLTIAKSEFKQVGGGTDTTIGESQRLVVGGSVEETIGASHKMVIGDAVETVIGGHHIEQTGSDYLLQVANNCSTDVDKVFNVKAGTNVYLKGGENVVIQSDDQICLSGPGGFITIGPAGVTIQGTIVMINSGGVAIPIVPVFPPTMGEGPKAPEAPDKPAFPGDDPPSTRK